MGRLAGADQLVGDALGLVDRNRKAEADRAALRVARIGTQGGDGGVNAHQLAVHVDQRPAGVTRVDRGVGLNGVQHGVLVAGLTGGRYRPVQRADDPRGHRARQTQRRADGQHRLTNPQIRRGTQGNRGEPGDTRHPDDGDIAGGIRPDHGERCGTAVGESHRRFGRRAADGGLAAAAMTWLLVKISPSADRMMPEPSSD